ncbi:MAG TPA: hypothetical protein VD707_01680 [Gemmatimonadales bacterium]|jgi:hypothetical protein|nr:hypothetical protein [Gemmatimonadales bacterium]
MKHLARVVVCCLGLVALAAAPAAAQEVKDGSNQWYWGAHVGGLGYATATQQTYWDPLIGAHWFITRRRFGLYAGIEQAFFTTDAQTVVAGQVVSFSEVRRFMAGLVALPLRGHIEPYFGGGFMVAYVVNPTLACGAACPAGANEALADQSTAAFAWGMGGGQINIGQLSVFGHYMVTDAAGFLIQGAMHSLQAGVRYSFGSATEGIVRR